MRKPTIFLALLCQFGSFHASAQEDNFDDGDADGWTELDPIGLITGGNFVDFSVTDGEYRFRATAESPDPGTLGPSRGIAYRADTTFDGSFFMSVDIPAYDASLAHAFGLFAMMSDIGPGSTDGYALAYNPSDGNLTISVVVDEGPVTYLEIGETGGGLGQDLRLVFEGKNGVMTGRLYKLSDLTTPLRTVTGTDTTYTSGRSGLFATNFEVEGNEGNGLTDATFDNYVASRDGFPDLKIALLIGNDFEVAFPDWAIDYRLFSSTDLTEWLEVPPNQLQRRDGLITYTSEAIFNNGVFYRLQKDPQ